MTNDQLNEIEARAEVSPHGPFQAAASAKDVPALVAELRRLQALRVSSVCTWCGLVSEDPDAEARAKSMTAHILECAKHPVGEFARKLEAEIDAHEATRERLATAEALLVKFCHGVNSQGREYRNEDVIAYFATAPTTGETSNE
jgi:hypothetical protein